MSRGSPAPTRVAGTSGTLNAANNAPINKRVTFLGRQSGGAKIPGSDANFQVFVAQTELPTTKKLALKQPAGTMIQIGAEFYVVGIDPVTTSAGNLSAFTNLADDGACKIITMAVEVHDPSGPVYEAGGLGLHPKHPRYIGAVLGSSPPVAIDALTNPVRIEIGAAATPFEIREILQLQANDDRIKTVNVAGGTDGTAPPAADPVYMDALNSLLALEDISIVAAPGLVELRPRPPPPRSTRR